MQKAAASRYESVTSDSRAGESGADESNDRDDGLGFFRGFVLAVLVVVPFWTALSVAVYFVFF
jgi:hypothetical protein